MWSVQRWMSDGLAARSTASRFPPFSVTGVILKPLDIFTASTLLCEYTSGSAKWVRSGLLLTFLDCFLFPRTPVTAGYCYLSQPQRLFQLLLRALPTNGNHVL